MLKKILKILLFILISATGLLTLCFTVANLPFSHKLIAAKINDLLQNSDIPLKINQVGIILPTSVKVRGIGVITADNDTLAYIDEINAEYSVISLIRHKIKLRHIYLRNPVLKLLRGQSDDEFSIVAAFSGNPSSKGRENKNDSKNWDFSLKTALIDRVSFTMEDSLTGLKIIQKIGAIKLRMGNMSLTGRQLEIKNIALNDLDFLYIDISSGTNIKLDLQRVENNGGSLDLQNSSFGFDNLYISGAAAVIDNKKPEGQNSVVDKKQIPLKWKLKGKEITLSDISFKMSDPGKSLAGRGVPEINVPDLNLRLSDILINDKKVSLEVSDFNFKTTDGLNLRKLTGAIESDLYSTSCRMDADTYNSKLIFEGSVDKGFTQLISNPSQFKSASLKITNSTISLKDAFFLNHEISSDPLLIGLSRNPFDLNLEIEIRDSILSISKCSVVQKGNFEFIMNGELDGYLTPKKTSGEINFNVSYINCKWVREILEGTMSTDALSGLSKISADGSISDSFLSPSFRMDIYTDIGDLGLSGSYYYKQDSLSLNSAFKNVSLGKISGVSLLGNATGTSLLNVSGILNRPVGVVASLNIDSVYANRYMYKNLTLSGDARGDTLNLNIKVNDSNLHCDIESVLSASESNASLMTKGTFRVNPGALHITDYNQEVSGSVNSTFASNGNGSEFGMNIPELNFTDLNNNIIISGLKGVPYKFPRNTLQLSDRDVLNLEFSTQKPLKDFKRAFSEFLDTVKSVPYSDPLLALSWFSFLPDLKIRMGMNDSKLAGIVLRDSTLHLDKLELNIQNSQSKDSLLVDMSGTGIGIRQLKVDTLSLFMTNVAGRNHLEVYVRNCYLNKVRLHNIKLASFTDGRNNNTRFSMLGISNDTLYDIGISLLKHGNITEVSVPSKTLVFNGMEWQLDSPGILYAYDKPFKIIPILRMRNDNSHLYLLSDTSGGKTAYNADLVNINTRRVVDSILFPGFPGCIITGKLNYSHDKRKGMVIQTGFKITDLTWSDLSFKEGSVTGYYNSEISGAYRFDLESSLDSSRVILKGEKSKDSGLSLTAKINEVPVSLADPFTKKYLSELKGVLSGSFNMDNKNGNDNITGDLKIKDAGLRIDPLNSEYTIPDGMVRISGKRMLFENFKVLDSLRNELHVDGYIGLDDNNTLMADMSIKASGLQVMNNAARPGSALSGKIFVNTDLKIEGPLKNPVLRGNLELAEGTIINYNQGENLEVKESDRIIKFISEKDSATSAPLKMQVPVTQTAKSYIDALLEINPSTRISIDLAERLYEIKIMIKGGGKLNYYMLENNMGSLSGKYVISDGDAEVNMVGWPNKVFRITKGGYINWEGNIEDPDLELEALNTIRASYNNPIDRKDRTVDFNVKLSLSGPLSNLKVVFTVQTEDQYLMSIINTLSPEEQMRQAVGVLLFQKVNLPGISGSTDYMTQQVNQLVATELNSLTRSTIKGIDLSFGFDSYVKPTGTGGQEKTTSLSYDIKRSFLNNRAQIEISGHLNEINKNPGAKDLSLNNFTFEYKLDSAATKFLKVYNEHTYEDVFEGDVIKTGVGFSYRKSYRSFNEIWKRRKRIRNVQNR